MGNHRQWHCAPVYILMVVAFCGCAQSTTPNDSQGIAHRSPRNPKPQLTFAQLQEAGDRWMTAGDGYRALEMYVRARALKPADSGIHYRTALAAADARQREPGLESIQKLIALKAKTKSNLEAGSDPEVLATKARLEALPKRDPATSIKIAAVESIVYEMRDETDPARFKELAEQARDMLREFVRIPGYADFDIWRLSGYVAVAQKDPSLGAFSFEAIERLRPDYSSSPHLRELMTELVKLPISEKVKKIPEETRFMKNGIEDQTTIGRWLVAYNFFAGDGVPRDPKEAVRRHRLNAESAITADNAEYIARSAMNAAAAEALGLYGCRQDEFAAQRYLEIVRRGWDATLIGRRKNDPKAIDGALCASTNAELYANAFAIGEYESGFGHSTVVIPISKNPEMAIKWYEVSIKIDPSNAEAQHNLGASYYKKRPPDMSRALFHFMRSAELGQVEGMYFVGQFHWNGDGTARNPSLAVQWWRKAATLGNDMAKAALSARGYSW